MRIDRRLLGLGFVAIAAFLFASHYLCTAIYGSNATAWSGDFFDYLYKAVGPGLTIAATLLFIIGIVYLIWGELEGRRKRDAV